jgi:glycosyltransferase involved in cell wall biosynthesis
MLTDAQRCIHIDEGKVALVPWGVGDAYFSATTRSSYSGGPKRLLFAGRLIRGKGVELALQALRRLSDDYTLTIAGDGPLREEVVWLANALGVQERVVFRGWLSREDLRAEFHRHHLLIAPSQVIEAFCLVAVEAQAAGLPVVHSRVGGLVESCANEELSFEPDDVSELAAAVRRAFADVNAWAAFAGRSASHARRYALTATAGAIERISLALVRAPQSATASGLRSW